MLFVVGPGHGAPAILAALWIEGSLERFFPQYSRDTRGLTNLISKFSTTAGLPRSDFPSSLLHRYHYLLTYLQPYQR